MKPSPLQARVRAPVRDDRHGYRRGTAAAGSSSAPSNVASMATMREAARRLHSFGAANVVVTGGHLDKAIDLLSFTTARGIEEEVFKAQRQRSTSTHGTGCAFSTALACHLALGRGLPEAVLLSKAYVVAAIANAQPLGHGAGPLHHLSACTSSAGPAQWFRRQNTRIQGTETSRERNGKREAVGEPWERGLLGVTEFSSATGRQQSQRFPPAATRSAIIEPPANPGRSRGEKHADTKSGYQAEAPNRNAIREGVASPSRLPRAVIPSTRGFPPPARRPMGRLAPQQWQ